MDEKKNAISNNLQIQWQDHFHMRDQTWKVLQYSILLFLGVVGLEIKEIASSYLIMAYAAVFFTSVFGVVIACHHRRRQNEKFEIIKILEHEIGIDELIKPVLNKAHSTWAGKISTSSYIVVMQLILCLISACLLIRLLIS